MSITSHPQPTLPRDIFQDYILPDLLSQHLHALLVDSSPPEWHAFYVLPLVCRFWYYTCQGLFSSIFGVKRRSGRRYKHDAEDFEDSEGFDDPDDYDPSFTLEYAISVWKRALHPASKMAQIHQHNRFTLLANKSLIRVYTCLALGRMFLNDDVLAPLGAFTADVQDGLPVNRGLRNAWDEDYEEAVGQPEKTLMDEARIHRCLMPFECAQRLCDFVIPRRLAYVAAGHLAEVLPLYHTLPLLAKYTRDLQFNVEREYKFDMEDYVGWTSRTLLNIEMAENLLDSMMSFGTLVRSFWDESGIPAEALKLTGIISTLDDVVRADWGADTITMRKRASALIRRWTVAK